MPGAGESCAVLGEPGRAATGPPLAAECRNRAGAASLLMRMTPRLALKQRPDAAFEKLYRQNVGDVYRYTLAVLGNPADAEDVTQTTFMNAYRAFHEGERPRKPTAW